VDFLLRKSAFWHIPFFLAWIVRNWAIVLPNFLLSQIDWFPCLEFRFSTFKKNIYIACRQWCNDWLGTVWNRPFIFFLWIHTKNKLKQKCKKNLKNTFHHTLYFDFLLFASLSLFLARKGIVPHFYFSISILLQIWYIKKFNQKKNLRLRNFCMAFIEHYLIYIVW